MLIQSNTTGRWYEPADSCFITNPRQAALYLKHGICLLDILLNKDDKIVYAFDKRESSPLYQKWISHELV